ncbi:MAG TPA: type I-U CRISPR-associated helicase/endonuclease Cas3, partial [Conexibacter sp.]|nr:type I-U CRISPR-associated helicase/endonuclease Cas3 [Conexibacter sp.]
MISFPAFLDALGLPEPYDWQRAFAERCAAGSPPAVVGVPTGSGKTTAVEALVWALAMQAERPAAVRTVGVRTVWAIDRRILVDEVHGRARRLAARLADALEDETSVLHPVAARLARLGGGRPLIATRWRGGIDDPRELLGPQQPQVITSTVAQIGSRLLFRGYGVAPGSLALEAGLAACDTTICLDEAHLAGPFKQTVAAVAELRAAAPAAPGLPALRLITLTATPSDGGDEEEVVRLSDADRRQLGCRYTGEKIARLADAGARANESARVELLVERTLGHVADGADSVACVANTVRRARAVFLRLKETLPEDVGLCLLIGPQRPVDRDRLLSDYGGKLFERSPDGKRLVCVATQTFEVGLDADVEAMVTESASMQALVQRLGRLNRRGCRRGRATIVRDPEPWL